MERNHYWATYSTWVSFDIGSSMSNAKDYLAKSIRFSAEARAATDPRRRADLEWLANSYRLLAEHAHDESTALAMTPQPDAQQRQPQQQQQGKLEPEE